MHIAPKPISEKAAISLINRHGETTIFDQDRLHQHLSDLAKTLTVDCDLILNKALSGLYNNMQTDELVSYLAESCAALIVDHPDYGILAARLLTYRLHQKTDGFLAATQALAAENLLDKNYQSLVREHGEQLADLIDYDRDYDFDYFALTTLTKAYLLKVNGKTIERPQDMWLRCAVSVTPKPFNLQAVAETYRLLSEGFYTHATPTLFNAGLKQQQLSSCFLVAMEDDSIEGIFNTLKDTALISKTAGGIGLHAHNIRASGALIHSTQGNSNGLIPFLKIFNETARSVDQGGGKRKGSFAIYLEPWHGDIEAFLELRKNTGAEEFRARDLFTALWIPDLFMQRVEQDLDWTLMSEDQCPGLSDCYGAEFEALYTGYEQEGRGIKTIKARDLMAKIIDAQTETGMPYMCYKDAVNSKSNQSNLGTIKSSNLCAEITEYSDANETAVCNLASIALPKFVSENGKSYDYQALYQVAKKATHNLNHVIDINAYPTAKTSTSNQRHRPIGLGIQGLADVFFKMGLAYDSEEAATLNKDIFETIYFASCEASCEIAEQHGTYDSYKGSPMSLGQFQFDLWGLDNTELSGRWDWQELRAKINQHGVRNSLLTACMPTASTGILLGNTETFQIQSSNLYKRQTLSGEFLLINRHLVQDLIDLDLWSEEMRDKIVLENGSIQNIAGIPDTLKSIYRTVWECSQKLVIDRAADRAPFIDQSQSMNLWLAEPTFGMVNSMHFYSWKKGLKTGMYYLRNQPATQAVKVTVTDNKVPEVASGSFCGLDDNGCLTCSA